jgi:DNA primase
MSYLDTLFQIAPQLLEGMKAGPNHVMIRCPFHAGGMEKTGSCAVATWKPTFYCHGCHESGHVARLLKHFGLGKHAIDVILPRDETYQKQDNSVAARMLHGASLFRGKYVLDEAILDYYRLMPTSLKNAGFKVDTLRHFEVGFDNKNVRITYPLRSVFGELLGVSGGTVIGAVPKYRIYENELKQRTDVHVPSDYSMEEAKSGILWHSHIVRPLFFLQNSGRDEMIITEGFKACMWTWQAGLQDVVAAVGSYITQTHAELIARATRKVCMLFDNNEAGIHGTHQGAQALLQKGIDVTVGRYPDAREQPDDLAAEEVRECIEDKLLYREWAKEHREPEDLRRIKKRWRPDH